MRILVSILFFFMGLFPAAADDHPLRDAADAYFRRDVAALEKLRTPFLQGDAAEAPTAAARRRYTAALLDYLGALSTGGNRAKAIELAKRADAEAEDATKLDASFAHAYLLRNRIAYLFFVNGIGDPKALLARTKEMSATAAQLAPDDPLVTLDAGVAEIGPRGDHDHARKLIRQSIDGLAATSDRDPESALWLPIVWGWYGISFLGDGDIDLARDAFNAALKIRPDYEYVRTAFLPMTAIVDSGTVPSFSADGWTTLVEDPTGDGRAPGMPDLRAVSWRSDAKRVWFRFELANDVDPDRFGINLALDVDDDQTTGNNWWAGNTAFKFDRLVTVWVRRGTDGRYRGAVGVADASDVGAGRMVTSAPSAVAFAVDASKRAIVAGVDRKAFGTKSRIAVVATVGTNITWNDVAPDTGSAIMTLK